MESAAERLLRAITASPSTRPVWRWQDWLRTLREVISGPLDEKAEQALLAVTRFNDKLVLGKGSSKPHIMSPEEMLKSLAVQALAQRTGLDHLLEMQLVEATTNSSVLASIVRAAIRDASQRKDHVVEMEVVPQESNPFRDEIQVGALGRDIGQKPSKALPQGKPKIEQAKQVVIGFFTKYEMPWEIRRRNTVNTAVIYARGLTYLSDHRVRRTPTPDD